MADQGNDQSERLTLRTSSGLGDQAGYRLVYLGCEQGLTYVNTFICDAFFGRESYSIEDRPVSSRDIPEFARGDLQVHVGDWADAYASAVDGVVLPLHLRLVVDLARNDPSLGPSPRELERQAKRMREHAYSYELSQEDSDFEHFFESMHVPTMAARHGSRARSLPKPVAYEQLFRRGFVFFLRSEGDKVAGVLCQVDGDVCHARLVGWAGGDPVHLRREALKTANHLLIDWARRSGIRRVDFQGCEPFLTKGTFQNKRHLGTTLVKAPSALGERRVWLTVGRDSPVVREFLVRNPVIIADRDGTMGAGYFGDSERPVRRDVPHRCQGLDFVRTIDLDHYIDGCEVRR